MAFWHAMFFGILGPLVGAAFLIGVIMPLTLGMGEQVGASDFPVALLVALPISILVAPFAVLAGAVPASVTGLTYWWLKSRTTFVRLPALLRVALMSLVGGAVCIIFGLCLGATMREMLSREILELFVTPGAAAASLCMLLADWRASRLPPEIRVQPTCKDARD